MKKLVCLFVLAFAITCLSEEVTVGTNTVTVVPSFGTANHCSIVNLGTNTIYVVANAETLVTSNAIPIVNIGNIKMGYTFSTPLIYSLSLKTTNGTSNVSIAFE